MEIIESYFTSFKYEQMPHDKVRITCENGIKETRHDGTITLNLS